MINPSSMLLQVKKIIGRKNFNNSSHGGLNNSFIIITALLLFCGTNFTFAQQSIVRAIKRGLELEYDFKWKQAEDIFQKMIDEYPNDPRGYHYQSSIYLWRYMSNQDKKDFDEFIAYSDTAISKGDRLMEKEHQDVGILYILGADYSYRALAFTKAEKFLDAVWASKKSESYLRKTLQADSTYYDAYLGLGLYNFAVGQIPAAFKWALSLAGIHGDVDLGLGYIKKAAKDGNISKVEAQYYLSQILSDFLFEYDKAAVYLKALVERYPNNLLFNYSDAVLDIKRRRLVEADKILSKIISVKDTNFQQVTAFSNFLMGDVLFKQNKFEAAKDFYRNFVHNARDNDYTGIAYYRLGLCFEITGDRDDAIKCYKLTEKGNMDIEDDVYAERRAAALIKAPLSADEIDLIKYSNMIDNAKYHAAYDSLSNLLEDLKTDRSKAEIYLNLSEAAYQMGLIKSSANFALTAKVLNNFGESWIKPYACYYAARANKKLGNEKNFKSLVEEAEKYSDFDYQKKLKNMIFALTAKE